MLLVDKIDTKFSHFDFAGYFMSFPLQFLFLFFIPPLVLVIEKYFNGRAQKTVDMWQGFFNLYSLSFSTEFSKQKSTGCIFNETYL